ncbi:MAG: hypothetical protein JNL08_20300 [Planctomycetes bacterium]|nr:hypothetical protein [Planctomycetota bacterium]
MNEPESNPVPAELPPPAAATEPAPADAGAAPGTPDGAAAAPGAATDGDRTRRRRRRRRRGKGGEPGAPGEATNAAPTGERPPRPERGPRPDRGPRPGPHGHGPRHGHGHGRGDSAHHAVQAVRALADMAHALLRVEGVDAFAMPRYLDLNLRVPLDGGNDVRHAAGTAVEQILRRVREVREHESALRPGAVYSYFAGTSHAEGCRPTEPRHVFDGYSSTGKPQFTDFVTMAIERKDPNIDRLLAGEEIVLTHVTLGRVLRTQQLAEFGGQSPVFKILGQVDAGLFRVLGAAGKCAFSFQLLRGSTLEGRVRLRLHPVSAVDPIELADPALMQILSRFQRRLDDEALRLQGQLQNGGEVDEEAFVLPLLNDFARQLQSRTRHAGRRTQHGLERSEEGQRPTSRAYPDAGEASDDRILWDLDQNTVVVLGPKGRVHVFTPAGKHVTSVMMQGAAIERRRHMGRWRLAEPEERGEFRIQIKRLVAAGQDTPQEDAPPLPAPPAPPPAG